MKKYRYVYGKSVDNYGIIQTKEVNKYIEYFLKIWGKLSKFEILKGYKIWDGEKWK